jgi:CubicO group peptidase (beta-lactamase class C family)
MNHVSGYPDYYPLDFVDRRMGRAIEPDELLRQYAGGKLDFEPGSRWSYSNTGYILLGRVVEKVSGEPFGAFLQRRVLRPLGLEQTVYEPAPSDQRLAGGYTTFALSDPESVGPEGAGWLGGAGGICSTPTDLAKWDLALMDGRLLKPESYTLMTAPRTLSDGKVTDYGCGLSVRLQGGRQVVSHNGAVSGFNTWNSMIPSTRSAVIMTCNLDGGLGTLPRDVLSLLLREPGNVPAVKGPPAVEQVKTLFAQFRRGKVTRATFGEEFNQFLTDQKIAGAAARLKPYRSLQQAEVTNSHERGGMEVTVTRLAFRNGVLRALMYRRPDGKVEQFFVDHE